MISPDDDQTAPETPITPSVPVTPTKPAMAPQIPQTDPSKAITAPQAPQAPAIGATDTNPAGQLGQLPGVNALPPAMTTPDPLAFGPMGTPPTAPNSPTPSAPSIPSSLATSPPTYPNSPLPTTPQVGGVTTGPGAQIAAIGAPAAAPGANLSSFYDSSVGGVYGAGAGGNVFLPDGTMANPNSLPSGYSLTPEAKSRLQAGFAVQLQPGGGATYLNTAAVNPSGLNQTGGVGTSNGTVEFNSNNPDSMVAAQNAGYVPQAAPTASATAGAQAAAAPWQNFSPAAPPASPASPASTPASPAAGPADTPQLPPDLSAPVGSLAPPTTLGAIPSVGGPAPAPASIPQTDGSQSAIAPQVGGAATPAADTSPSLLNSRAPDTNTSSLLPTLSAITNGASTTSPAAAVNLSPTDPNNPLTNSTITPGQMADRQALARQSFSDFTNATDPAYQAALRSATQASAAAGGLGSGMLRTSYGNLENNRAQQLDTAKNQFLTAADQGSIDDAWKAIQLAQQQQQFQSGQQGTAFNQNVQEQELQDALTNSSFGRSLSTLNAGQTGNPTQTNLALSAIFGGQSSDAAKALAQLLSGSTANANSTGSGGISDLLKALGIGGGGAAGAAAGGTTTSAGSAAPPDDWSTFTDSPEDYL